MTDQGRGEPRSRDENLLKDTLELLGRFSARLQGAAGEMLGRLAGSDGPPSGSELVERLDRLRREVSGTASAERALGLQLDAVAELLASLRRAAPAGAGPRATTGATTGAAPAATADPGRRLAEIVREHARLQDDLDALVERCRRLAGGLEQVLAPGGSPAGGAAGRIGELGMLGELDELNEAEAAVRRLDARVSAARAGAGALARLLAAPAPGATGLDETLSQMGQARAVEAELAQLKEQMRAGRRQTDRQGPGSARS